MSYNEILNTQRFIVNATTTPILTSGVRVEIGSTIIWSFNFAQSSQ